MILHLRNETKASQSCYEKELGYKPSQLCLQLFLGFVDLAYDNC